MLKNRPVYHRDRSFPVPGAVQRAGRPMPSWGRSLGGFKLFRPRDIFGRFGVRLRLLAWCILLMILFGIVSSLLIDQVLFFYLEDRIEAALAQEAAEFRALTTSDRPGGSLPVVGKPLTGVLDEFLTHNIPPQNTFYLTFADGAFHKASPQALPPLLAPDSPLTRRLAGVSLPQRSEVVTADGQRYVYLSEPLKAAGRTRGGLVLAHCVSCERQFLDQCLAVIGVIFLLALALASVIAWFGTGRVLAPLQQLLRTVRAIDESDLTRRVHLHEQSNEWSELACAFNAMLGRLEGAFQTQRHFVNEVSHELRTPLTIIRGHLELIGDDPHERAETMHIVHDELGRMHRFVESLLLLDRLERHDGLHLEPLEVDALTRECFAKARGLGRRQWQLPSTASGCRIHADRHCLTQAVLNLAQNAVKFTTHQDRIAIGSSLVDGRVHLWVTDSGPGVPLEAQGRIFECFERGSCHRHIEGNGLGLAIVRSIAVAHGGEIRLQSVPGHGATFILVLPLAPQN